jgi:hypothetical protein
MDRESSLAEAVEGILESEPLWQVDSRVVIGGCTANVLTRQARVQTLRVRGGKNLMPRQRGAGTERVVQGEPEPQLQCRNGRPRHERDHKLQWLHEVRRYPQQRLAFAEIQTHQPEVEHLQVSQSAVNDPSRCRRRSAPEVALFEQHDAQPPQGRIARDTAPDDAPAYDRDVELFARERCQP